MLNIKPSARTVRFEKHFPGVVKVFRGGIRRGAYMAGDTVMDRVEKMLTTGTRTGIKYPNLPNRSSAAGEPPRSQSGRLVRSGGFAVRGSSELRVFENAPYAWFLERGTRNIDGGVRMAPHPHMIVAIKEEERNTEKYLQDGPYKAIKRI